MCPISLGYNIGYNAALVVPAIHRLKLLQLRLDLLIQTGGAMGPKRQQVLVSE